jgi:rod shape-determining protein MreD
MRAAMDERTPGIRPAPSLGRRLDAASRQAVPFVATLALMLLFSLPLGLLDQAALLPASALVCVFFFSLHRPAALPPPAVFVLGVVLDLLAYLPLGVGTLVLLVVCALTNRARRFLLRHGFPTHWATFVLIAAFVALLTWLLNTLLLFRALPAGPVLFQFAIAAALYPALHAPLAWANATIADPDRA